MQQSEIKEIICRYIADSLNCTVGQLEQEGTFFVRNEKEKHLEKVAKGIYISQDTWMDELYILQICNPKIVYSGETALYLHDMIDREYANICVSVPPRFNQTRLRDKGVIVHQEKTEAILSRSSFRRL